MSPGLRSRPSLSVVHFARWAAELLGRPVSPGLRSRPSLSDQLVEPTDGDRAQEGVAGTTVPAFVERIAWSSHRR